METNKKQKTTITLSEEERKQIIKTFEEAAHRPWNKFYTLSDEWDLAYSVQLFAKKQGSPGDEQYDDQDDDQDDDDDCYSDEQELEGESGTSEGATQKGPSIDVKAMIGFEPVGRLPQKALDAIALVYKTNDQELKDGALFLARASMRPYIISKMRRYCYDKKHQEEFVSTANMVIVTNLPKYDASTILITFFERPLNKEFGITLHNIDPTNSSRHYADIGVKLKRATSEMLELGIVDPNPPQLSAYMARQTAVRHFRKLYNDPQYEPTAHEIHDYLATHESATISVVSIMNYFAQVHKIETLDKDAEKDENAQQGYNSLALVQGVSEQQSELYRNPEEAAIRHDSSDEVLRFIATLDPLRRRICEVRLDHLTEHDSDISRAELVKRLTNDALVKSRNLSNTDLQRAISALDQEMIRRFRNDYRQTGHVLNSIASYVTWFQEEADMISESIDLMDLDDLFEG